MDVLEIVRSEHERITELFEQIKAETGKQARKLLFNNIRYSMDLHLYALDHVFLPALARFEECQSAASQVRRDSSELRRKLEELENAKLDIFTVNFENKVLELKNHFENHVTREERELFPAVRQVMNFEERERTGRLFQNVEHEREEAA